MSNHAKLLVSIRDYLSRFQLQVKIATANSEYDLNQHAENIILPILDLIFKAKFKNVNETDRKNFESLDLIDDNAKIGIQVTATNSLEKVKSTLTKFIKYGHSKRVDRVLVYVLTEKQKSYAQDAIDKIVKGKIPFNTSTQILDATDIYGLIKSTNDVLIFQIINELLELQFSDLKIARDFNYSDFATFKASYREKCLNNFSRLNFFGLSVSRRPREVELYELFVPPLFTNRGMFRNIYHQGSHKITYKFPIFTESKLIDTAFFKEALLETDARMTKSYWSKNLIGEFAADTLEDLFSRDHKLVILGNPGAGKSSIIKYSICKILEGDEAVFSNNDIYRYLPFRIELHRYNQVKVAHNIGFAEFLVQTLASEYQTNISLERIIKILTFFPCLIFFDGIDEIFDIQERINVRNDIENFASTYPDARIVVTSRFESYEEVAFKDFHELEVKNFNQEQLTSYVQKWYTQEEQDTGRRQKEITGCLAQLTQVDEELKFNPLLLSLILILYRNELELPTNKLAIYEGCTNTIVEHRDDKEKKLKISLQINNKASVFSSIAFWQFDNPNKRINNSVVQQHIKAYLLKNGEIEDERLANKAAIEFLEFAKLRSIYFENKFTHKTFLEYFTAYYIFSSFYMGQNQRRFNDILDRNLGLASWAVVLELLICKIDSNLINSKIIAKIIEAQLQKNKNDALMFFLQILKYITNINEKIIVNLITLSIQSIFADTFPLKESKIDHAQVLFGHLINIYAVDRFRSPFRKAFEAVIKSQTLALKELTVFAYEFSNGFNENSLIMTLQNEMHHEETAELFLLKNFKSVGNEDSYLAMLNLFIERFGVEKIIPVYHSSFGQQMFFGSDRFNWILTFILLAKPDECFKQYTLLKSTGLSQAVIRQAAHQKMLSKSIVEPYAQLLKGLPQSGYRDFLQNMVKPYYRKTLNQGNEKFYDAFYTKEKKQ
ncbi:SMEK domain-containing protein [Mucilaginibacter sp. BJC16-A38]|uniref:SMEK domain-containing protein n=1 Tax=Mucilaginibacter phenanthrenivorans TaxID=1234842 RepID=UPI00215827DF|nr:SMEK domain-containing protein [Mucilaginibacter phenanthrenivorans]MCR8561606.1 SMEK domain-containing protein [Mucilaginibacter phenanthrenivorans]